MTEKRKSVCALDCPDTCALVLDINTAGRAVKLSGDKAHPVTRGFLCAKVTNYLEREYHPDRLLYPLRRTGVKGEGKFERISWDAALDEIASRLSGITREHGPEAILPYSYAGTHGHAEQLRHGPALFPPPGRIAAGPDHLLYRPVE